MFVRCYSNSAQHGCGLIVRLPIADKLADTYQAGRAKAGRHLGRHAIAHPLEVTNRELSCPTE